MQPTSLFTSDNLNYSPDTSSFWSGGGNRKRKVDESDLDEKTQHKMFLTEEKLIQNMRTLSLQLPVNNQPIEEDQHEQINENEQNNLLSPIEPYYELHKLVKDNLKKDEFQDEFINKIYNLERKRFSMQIVPYMPIHPAQLNTTNLIVGDEEQKKDDEISKAIPKKENDDHLFKKPFLPVPYTVEEPCENPNKRTPRMKRSYSQSVRYNNNLTVVELKNDANDSPIRFSQSDYFILEPSTPVLAESSTNQFHSSLNKPSVHITEYFDFPTSKSFDDNSNDDVVMHSSLSFDACDQMDDDF